MYRLFCVIAAVMVCLIVSLSAARAATGVPEGFVIYQVKKGDTWKSVIPDARWRELAKRVNRMNIELTRKSRLNVKQIWLPVNDAAWRYVPVPVTIDSQAPRELIFYKKEQYFGAYEHGHLIRWGPISTGRSGNTPVGTFRALYKQREKYSHKYNNSRMFFAVQFQGNFFSHEQILPGYAASKGCVRMFWEDAEWKYDWIRLGDRIKVVKQAGIDMM